MIVRFSYQGMDEDALMTHFLRMARCKADFSRSNISFSIHLSHDCSISNIMVLHQFGVNSKHPCVAVPRTVTPTQMSISEGWDSLVTICLTLATRERSQDADDTLQRCLGTCERSLC